MRTRGDRGLTRLSLALLEGVYGIPVDRTNIPLLKNTVLDVAGEPCDAFNIVATIPRKTTPGPGYFRDVDYADFTQTEIYDEMVSESSDYADFTKNCSYQVPEGLAHTDFAVRYEPKSDPSDEIVQKSMQKFFRRRGQFHYYSDCFWEYITPWLDEYTVPYHCLNDSEIRDQVAYRRTEFKSAGVGFSKSQFFHPDHAAWKFYQDSLQTGSYGGLSFAALKVELRAIEKDQRVFWVGDFYNYVLQARVMSWFVDAITHLSKTTLGPFYTTFSPWRSTVNLVTRAAEQLECEPQDVFYLCADFKKSECNDYGETLVLLFEYLLRRGEGIDAEVYGLMLRILSGFQNSLFVDPITGLLIQRSPDMADINMSGIYITSVLTVMRWTTTMFGIIRKLGWRAVPINNGDDHVIAIRRQDIHRYKVIDYVNAIRDIGGDVEIESEDWIPAFPDPELGEPLGKFIFSGVSYERDPFKPYMSPAKVISHLYYATDKTKVTARLDAIKSYYTASYYNTPLREHLREFFKFMVSKYGVHSTLPSDREVERIYNHDCTCVPQSAEEGGRLKNNSMSTKTGKTSTPSTKGGKNNNGGKNAKMTKSAKFAKRAASNSQKVTLNVPAMLQKTMKKEQMLMKQVASMEKLSELSQKLDVNCRRAMRLILCPDELEEAKSLPVLPTAVTNRQYGVKFFGQEQATFGTNNILVTAAGQHTLAFVISNSVATVCTAGDLLLIDSGSVDFAFRATDVPTVPAGAWGYGATTSKCPRLISRPSSGFLMSTTASANIAAEISPPTPVRFTGAIKMVVNDGANYYQTGSDVLNAQVLLCGAAICSRATCAAEAAFGYSFQTTSATVVGQQTQITLTPLLFTNGSDVRQSLTQTGSFQYMPQDQTCYPNLYPANNHRIKIYPSTLQTGISYTNFYCQGGESGPFGPGNVAQGGAAWVNTNFQTTIANISQRCLQTGMGALSVEDKDWNGCNIRSGIASVNPMIGEVLIPDLAYATGEMPGGATVTVGSVNGVLSNSPTAGWGDCCAFSITIFRLANVVSATPAQYPIVIRTDAWFVAFVNALSAFYSRPGMYSEEFANFLQEAATWPGIASYHSFWKFFSKVWDGAKDVGSRAAAAALGAAKGVAVDALVPMLMAL